MKQKRAKNDQSCFFQQTNKQTIVLKRNTKLMNYENDR